MNTLLSEKLSKRNNTVGIARVISMFMIIGCHLCSWLGINSLAMILNVGVYVFLIISGILYSKKTITQPWTFLKKRWCKLCIPMYLLFLLLLIYNIAVSNYNAIRSVPTYLINLQGLGFIINSLDLPYINELGHLWFLTVIMLCYMLLVIVKKIENRISFKATSVATSMVAFCILDVVFSYTINVQLHYFIAFFIGYILGKIEERISLRNYLCLSGTMLCAMVIRLIMRILCDGTITYNSIVAPFTHIVLALWIYTTIQYICRANPDFTALVAESNVMNWLDGLSLYVYMTHYMFLVGPFCIDMLLCPKFVQLFVFGASTFISASVLKLLSQKTIQVLFR